jgi:hypothetical protein
MRRVDIAAEVESNPSVAFAAYIRVPGRFAYEDARRVIPVTVVDASTGRIRVKVPAKWNMPRYEDHGENEVTVQPHAILDTWERYTLDKDHAEAIQLDRSRDERIAYDKERALRAALIEALLPAFSGIMIPSTSSGNMPIPDTDLAVELREIFVESGAVGSMFRWEHFAPIAERIIELQQGGGWTGGPVDDGIARVDPVDRTGAALAALERSIADE